MKKFFTLCFASMLLLCNSVSVFANKSVVDKTNSNIEIHSINPNGMLIYQHVTEYEADRFDEYVILEDGKFVISDLGYLELSQNEIHRLNEILNNTNSNIEFISSTAKYVFVDEDKIIFADSMVKARSGGVNKIEHTWLGPRVFMSASTLNTMGVSVSIAGVVITHPVASRAAQIAGIVMTSTSRGIWFDINPIAHMIPSSVWGAGLQ